MIGIVNARLHHALSFSMLLALQLRCVSRATFTFSLNQNFHEIVKVNLRGVRIVRQKHREGTLRYGPEANKIYAGTWKQDKFHGIGEHSTPFEYYKGYVPVLAPP